MRVKEELQEAMLWHKERNGVRCDLCALNCFISKDKLGACSLRKNVGNRLFTLNSGKLAALGVDNVEKRPLFHFYPGSKCLALAGQATEDWQIEHDRLPKCAKTFTPESVVRVAEKEGVQAICFTHSEPTLFFEFIFRVARLAHRSNIKNVFVSNGLITPEAIKKIAKYLDAAVINFKASGDPGFMRKFCVIEDINPIFSALRQMRKQRIHIEITNLIVPQIGDSVEKCKRLAEWIATELGSTIPFHVLQFHPGGKLTELPFTSIAMLEECAEEARKSGLRYAYLGNLIEPHREESTYCYNCRELLIERACNVLKKNNLIGDRCPNCGVRIDLIV